MFQKKKRIPERDAHKMIVLMAKHGNHYKDIHGVIKSVKYIKDHFKQNGMSFSKEVSRCRNFDNSVHLYENLLGAQWVVQGASVSRYDPISGEQKRIISGNGVCNESDYWANFDIAREDFEDAIKLGKYERLLSAVNAGLAAIEAFLNQEYMRRLRVTNEDPALQKELESKFTEWVPKFTGQKFDKSHKAWAHFKELKKLRNEGFQHRKSLVTGVTFEKFEKELNMFRTGICQILLDLHILFNVRCTTWIIRYSFYPDVVHISEQIDA